MAISITRLSGGTAPADGSDPRTFPTIWNATATVLEGFSVDDLADVDAAAPNDGDVLVWNAGSAVWLSEKAAAGAVGGGTDEVFWENGTAVTTSYSITSGRNAMTAGPISIGTAATVTVPSGSVWTVV